MKRIASIQLKNFKAFRDQTFDFEAKNVLIYGNNGSGKSSLFWAIYTFLQSSIKQDGQIRKYFEHFDAEKQWTYQSLKNVFAGEEDDSFVKLKWGNEDGILTEQIISKAQINTNLENDETIREANLSSDFINYKLLQNFYNVTHKQEVNLWQVFMRDVFPFFYEDARDVEGNRPRSKSYRDLIDDLRPRITRSQAVKSQFQAEIRDLNEKIELFLGQIETNANDFLLQHFFDGKNVVKVRLKYKLQIGEEWIKQKEKAEQTQQPLPEGFIKLWVEIYDDSRNIWIENHRPHSFLNEAQLTRMAIAIRIGALRTRLFNSDFKVLCLDDMLISLDMSNRDKVIKMILNRENKQELEFFDDYQKIILTHDKAFFNLIKRFTFPQEWKYFELCRNETSNDAPTLKPSKSYLEKAQDFFDNGEYAESAVALRKEIEATLKDRMNLNLKPSSQHLTLTELIHSVRYKICEQEQERFERLFVRRNIPLETLVKIQTDFESNEELDQATKGSLRGTQKALHKYLVQQYEIKETVSHLISQVQFIVDFNLNQNAHDSTNPNYQEEIQNALEIVRKLKTFFENEKK